MISTLKLQNFRRHIDSFLDLNPACNLIMGCNGSGKTSVIEAIHLCFLGKTKWSAGTGKGLAGLVSKDATVGLVEVQSPHMRMPVQVPPPSFDELRKNLNRMHSGLGVKADTIAAVLNAGDFLKLSDDDQVNILFRCLGEVPDAERYMQGLLNWDKKIPDLQDFFGGEADGASHLTTALGGQKQNEDIRTCLYNYAFSQRREAKKALKAAEVALESTNLPERPEMYGPDKEAQLAELRDSIVGQIASVGERNKGAQAAYKTALDNFERETAERTRLEAEATRISNNLNRLTKPAAPTVIVDPVSLSGSQKALEAVQGSITRFRGEFNDLREKQSALSDQPMCIANVCNNAENKRLNEQTQGVVKRLETLDETRKKLEDRVQSIKAALRIQEQHAKDIAAYHDRKAELDEQMDDVQSKLVFLPDNVERPVAKGLATDTDLRAQLAGVDRDITALAATKRAVESWDAQLAKQQNQAMVVDLLKWDIKRWESLVKAFDGDGILRSFLSKTIASIVGLINADLESHFRLECVIHPAPWEINVGPAGGEWAVPATSLSNGEQAKFNAVLQVVLGRLSRFGLVTIDDEGIDAQSRRDIIAYLRQQKDVQSVLVGLIAPSERPLVNGGVVDVDSLTMTEVDDLVRSVDNVPGLSVFWCNAGRVYAVGQVAVEEVAA